MKATAFFVFISVIAAFQTGCAATNSVSSPRQIFANRVSITQRPLKAGQLPNVNGICPPLTSVRYAYVTNTSSNEVSVISEGSNSVVKTIAVGGQPSGAAVNLKKMLLYVTNAGDNTVSDINPTSDSVIATIAVGAIPFGVAINPVYAEAYVANDGANTLSVIDTGNNTVLATVALGGSGAGSSGVVVSPNGLTAYVTLSLDNSVAVVDIPTKTVIKLTAVGKTPEGLAIDFSGKYVYTANQGDGTVSVLDTSSNSVVATIPIFGEPGGGANDPFDVAINPSNGLVYVSTRIGRNVSIIDPATNTVIGVIDLSPNLLEGISIDCSGKFLYVEYFMNQVVVINLTTEAIITTIPVSKYPYTMGLFAE